MTGRTVLVVQHQDDCPPAWFGTWLAEAGVQLDLRRPDRGDALPADLTEHDGLLVLGGSMGASDHDEAPWLHQVEDLVRSADGRPVLGICLGHQVIARALGGRVQRNPAGTQRAILDVGWTREAARDAVFGERPRRAAHWNDDVVTVPPPGSVVLATAPGGEVQAVRYAERTWGIQAHPEIDEDVLRDWIADASSGEELLEAYLVERDMLVAEWKQVALAFARTIFH